MASILSLFRRQKAATRKTHTRKRKRGLLLERLEERLAPAANLLVTTTFAATEQVLREFTSEGAHVRTALLPVLGADWPGRDLVYDQSGKVHVYNGTFDPSLSSYVLAGGGWTQRTHAGWSTFNNTSNGGIGILGDFVYVTDMTTFGEPADVAKGVVRFNLVDGTSARFLETEEPQDLTIGQDGRLYLLSLNTVKAYDPATFALQNTVTLPAGDFRGIAVNAAGEIFAASWGGQVHHLSASGAALGSVTLTGVSNPMDIDVSGDGRVAVGTASGHVVQMSEDLTGITTFLAGSQRAFVAFGPDEAESPPVPTPPTLTLSSDLIHAEGNSGTSYAVYTVTLSEPSVDPIAFQYTTTGGTATSGSDYWGTGGRGHIYAGQTSTQIYVNIVGDTVFEGDETFTLTLSDAVGATIDADNSALGTITNDDPSTPYFLVDDVSRDEGGQFAGTLFSFLVKLSTPSTQTVTVNYATRDNTAVAGSDYAARSGTLTFNPGQLQQAVDVTVLGDLTVESDETFFVELSNASGADITDPQAVGAIVNDDSVYQLSINNVYANEGNVGSTSADFTVSLNQPSTGQITVNYYTSGGDATAGTDYIETWGTLFFDPGETSKTISVPIVADTDIEQDESFFIVLTNPWGASLANFYGTATIANDDSTAGNTAPIAADDAYETAEDYPLSVNYFGVLANDYDAEDALLQAYVVNGPAHGELYLDPGGSFYYIPDTNYNGPDSFTYRATDSGGLSDLATVSLTVWEMDDPIELTAPGPQTTAENTTLTFSWTNGNAITVSDLELPRVMVALLVQNGILTLPSTAGLEFPYPDSTNNSPYITFYADDPAEANLALNGLIFTPAADFEGGLVNLDIMVTDLSGTYYQPSDYATVPITVSPVNDAPLAAADAFETWEDVPLTVYGQGVLFNDFDPDYDLLSTTVVTGPAHGAVTLNLDGTFVYTPDPNFNGTDSFTYSATDPGGLSSQATVTITVWEMNDPVQVAVPGPQTTAEDTPITFSTAGGNALTVSDQESQRLIVALLVQDGILTLPSTAGLEFPYPESTNNSPSITFYADNPAEANAALDGLVFTPNANFNGQVSLSLFVQEISVTFPPMEAFDVAPITVTPVNDAPVAVDDTYAVEAGVPFVMTLGGGGSGLWVTMNDQDVDMEPISAVLVSGPSHGTLTFNPDGTVAYTAEATYSGTDTFTYRASDGQLESGLATATFTVTQVNYAPVASNDNHTVDEDGVLTIAAPGVLGNDTDGDGDTLSSILVSGPSHGVLTFNADGSFIYTPSANYNGSDSFTYKANDGQSDSNVATVTITVNAIDDSPVAVNDAYSLNEDQTLTVAPLPGVTSLVMFSQPGDYIGQGQTYSFTPQTGTFMANRNFDNGVSVFYSGSGHTWNLAFAAPFEANLTPGYYADATRFPFQAANVPGLSVSGNGRGSNTLTGHFTVTQAVYAANGDVLRFAATFEQHSEGLPPALTGEIKINQGDGVSGILYNDSDVEGNPLTIIVVANPEHGTLSMNVDGSFSYTPHANYNGADSFTYKLSDGTSESNVATVALTVNPVNDFPTANNDAYSVAEDTVLTVAAPGVLANDSDVDGNSLTATLVTSPTHGSLTFNADGSFTYTPHVNYNGSDIFKYAAYDGTSLSFIRTVTLTVTNVNDAPTANDDSYTTAEDTPLTVAASGLLGNDTDVEGTALTALLVDGPAHGTLTLNSNGSFTYTPHASYNGPDSFTYTSSDGAADSNVATVSLTVTAVDDAPTASDDAYAVTEDQAMVVAASGVLGNDSDVETSLTANLISGPAYGTLTLNADGSFTYTPDANFHGADSFTYKAHDGNLDSNVAVVSLTIAAVADAPAAADDAYAVDEDNSLAIAATGVLGNDSDADGDSLNAVLVSGPTHGTVTVSSDGSFIYTPDANFHGNDSFTYVANDASSNSNFATVSLTVSSVNDAPTAAGDAYAASEDQTLVVAASGVIGNDTDVDGDSLSAVLVSGPAHGALTLNADGSFTYTPDSNFSGSDSFTYKTNDGSTDSNVVTVSLTINSVNDAPVANAGPDGQNGEGAMATFDAFGSFDIDGDELTYSWDFGDGNTANGKIVQYAHADQGTYTVTLTVSDGVASTTDTLILSVLNVAPLSTLSGPGSGVRGQTQTFTLGALDPSPFDQAADFAYSLNWGDGNTENITGPVGSQIGHVYAATGTYTVSVQATDKDGDLGDVVQQSITISSVLLQSGNLVVGGTTSSDTINLKVADTGGGVRVTINGVNQGVFNPTGAIFVYAQAGTDNVKFETTKFNGQTRYIQDAAFVYGDAGNDSLDARGSSAKNVIVGGSGNDTIWGGTGRDILIGGQGTDTLRGGAGDDLLIGNVTIYDADLAALTYLMAEWGRTDANFSTRAGHLLGNPGGLNEGYFLDPSAILTDAAIDQLYGESGIDLFFTGSTTPADSANDLGGSEMKVGL